MSEEKEKVPYNLGNVKTRTNLSSITPNKINDDIYSHTDVSDLTLSLETNGQLEPIVLNNDDVILSGHRRYYAMLALGWTECNVRYINVENDIIALIEFNRSRIKSVNDILNESRHLEKEYKKVIGRGRTATKQRSGKKMATIVEVSERLGLSTTQLKKIKSIANYDASLIEQIDCGEMSVHQAYEKVRAEHMSTSTVDDKEMFSRKLTKILKDYQPSENEIYEVMNRIYPFSVSNILNGEDKRDELVHHLDTLKKLDEREIVQYRKYKEMKSSKDNQQLVDKLEKQLWKPIDINNKKQTINEIKNLRPTLEVNTGEEFRIIRQRISSFEWVANPGRKIQILVRNKDDNKLLGVITIASDMIMVENRDNHIGWDEKERLKNLKHLAVVSTCVSSQPLGFNFLGGKLLATLSTSKVIRDLWKEKYGDTLIGLTTTSLFGQFSQYNSTRVWKSLGETKGSQLLKPDESYYKFWKDWVKEHYEEEYEKGIKQSSPKQNVLNLIFKYLGIEKKNYTSEHRKGLYFASVYKNGREFLCNEINEDALVVDDKFDVDAFDWWIEKAVKRYTRLHEDGKLNGDTLWYDDLDDNNLKSWFSSRGIDELI